MILNDEGTYWRQIQSGLSLNDLNSYTGLSMDMKEFVTLFGNGRIFQKPGWILIAHFFGGMIMYPEPRTTMLRYSRSAIMLEKQKDAFTRMKELLYEGVITSECEMR